MIISASRRTDIPAFYNQWFMNRIRAGWCLVPNPFNPKQVARVSLLPSDIDAIVFWSKNPAPLMAHLDELDELGLRYYFQFTLNNYPKMLEPRVPDFNNRIETFLGLSERLGAARVIWRYDPIIISNLTSYEFHLRNFARIADSLKGATQQVMVSMLDFYQKTSRHLCELKQRGIVFDREADSSMDVNELMRGIAQIAKSNGMAIFSCAEERDFTEVGVPPGHCIDEYLLHSLWEFPCKNKKDPGQRKQCGCAVSKDIGINNTCIHGCPYCYATGNCTIASRRYHEHNPASPAMCDYRKL